MKQIVLAPVPKNLIKKPGFFVADDNWCLSVMDYSIDSPLPDRIRLQNTHSPLHLKHPEKNDYYRLLISPGEIILDCCGEKSTFLAMKTLHQLLLQRKGGAIPCMEVEDWSDYRIRGVMLDISRDRVPTMETLYLLIDLWALLKINQVQLYMEHTFAYRGHEKVWRDASPLTPEEVRTIDLFCRQRGIDLVPNQNAFGHMERWLQYPEYHHLAECPGGFTDPWGVFRPVSSTLAPSVEEVAPFLQSLFDQLLPNFSSSFFNVGGDEPWELGKGKSRELCERDGLEQVYIRFLRKLYSLVSPSGKQMMVWADILMKHPYLVGELPDDVIVVNWGYEADHPFEEECKKLEQSGKEYHLCVGTSSWNSIGGRWTNAEENIHRSAAVGLVHGAGGFIICEWGDNGHWQQFPVQLPGYVYAAAAAWNCEALESLDLEKAVALFTASPPAAQALMLLERVGESGNPGFHNANLPGALLMDHLAPYYRKDIEGFKGYQFEKENQLLDQADAIIEEAGTASQVNMPGDLDAGAGLLVRELQFTSYLLRFACDLGRLRLSTPGLSTAEIDPAHRKELARRLDSLIAEYQALWLLRSREGGLKESARRLEQLSELLKGKTC